MKRIRINLLEIRIHIFIPAMKLTRNISKKVGR